MTSSSSTVPKAIKTGSIILAVAVLEVISVKKLILAITTKTNKNEGKIRAPFKLSPIQTVKSVAENPLAIARPAPNISKTPHGKLLATSQFIKRSPAERLEGIKNKRRAPVIAIIVSSSLGTNLTHINERVTHINATNKNT